MSWQLVSMIVLLIALGTGMLWYERSRPPSQIVALVAVLAALAVAGRIVFAPIPNLIATTDIVILSGFVLGPAPGFAVGALGGLISNFWLGQGVWTPWQMVAWGMCGVAGGGLGKLTGGRINRWWLAAFCGAAGIAFGAWMNLQTMVSFGGEISLDRYLALEVRAIPFDIAHMIGNVVFALAAGPAMIAALTRFRRRFEWSQIEGGASILRSGAGATMVVLALALILLGGSAANPGSAQASPVGDAKQWLAKQVNQDGGFSRRPGGESTLSTTNDAILGLSLTGRDVTRMKGRTPINWLKNHPNKITQGEGRANAAGSLAKTVLALHAAKQNPRNFAGRNLVDRLATELKKDHTAGDRVNTAAFAVMALRSVNRPPPTTATERWLCRSQNSDGGWGIRKGATSDIDSTGPALLVVGGKGYAGPAIGFLRKSQGGSGGFSSGFGSPNSQSTAMAIQGMLGAGFNVNSMISKGGYSALAYLKDMQDSSGAIKQGGGIGAGDTVWTTAQALPGLAEKPLFSGKPRNCADFEPKESDDQDTDDSSDDNAGGTSPGTSTPGTTLSPGSLAGPADSSPGNTGRNPGPGSSGPSPDNFNQPDDDASGITPTDPVPGDLSVPLVPAAPSAEVLAASEAGPQPSALLATLIGLGVSGLLCGGTILLARRFRW